MRPMAAALLLALCSCGSMFAPGPDYIDITTDPPGASVIVAGQQIGITPCRPALSRTWPRLVILTLDGYHQEVVALGNPYNGYTWLNVLWAVPIVTLPVGLIGIAVDYANGNDHRWPSAPLRVVLRPAR